jgi:predicted DNA-binding antitoxin AbrB/MazE fold protein
MTATVEAVYENGVFRPETQPALAEGAHVTLIVESAAAGMPDEVLHLAAQVYAGMSSQDIDEVERIAQRRTFFDEHLR